MIRYSKVLAALVFALAAIPLAGCGGGAQPDAAALAAPLPKSHARVKIHRESNVMGMAADARLTIDGKQVEGLGNGDSRVFTLPAGQYRIAVDHWGHPGTSTLDLTVKPGMLYELAIEVRGDAAAAGIAFGIIGAAVESASSNNSGYWSIRVAKQGPAA
jgi:hypothetical protein